MSFPQRQSYYSEDMPMYTDSHNLNKEYTIRVNDGDQILSGPSYLRHFPLDNRIQISISDGQVILEGLCEVRISTQYWASGDTMEVKYRDTDTEDSTYHHYRRTKINRKLNDFFNSPVWLDDIVPSFEYGHIEYNHFDKSITIPIYKGRDTLKDSVNVTMYFTHQS
jgi:hypothetical protein